MDNAKNLPVHEMILDEDEPPGHFPVKSHGSPLMQPINFRGHRGFALQYFFAAYMGQTTVKDLDKQFKTWMAFQRALYGMQAFRQHVDTNNIITLFWGETEQLYENARSVERDAAFKPLFAASQYQPIMVINEQAQYALAHALDDEFSRHLAVASRVVAIPPAPRTLPAGPTMDELEWAMRALEKLGQFNERDKLMFADLIRTTIRRKAGLGQEIAAGKEATEGFDTENLVRSLITSHGLSITDRTIRTMIQAIGRVLVAEYRTRYGKKPTQNDRDIGGKPRPVNWYPPTELDWATACVTDYLRQYGYLVQRQVAVADSGASGAAIR